MGTRLLLCLGCLLLTLSSVAAQDNHWITIDDGMSYAKFRAPATAYSTDSTITVIRIDPKLYALKLLTVSELGGENRTVRQWVKEQGLIAAINAGMYLTDYTTSCGYMKNHTHFNNRRFNKTYHSFVAFNPVKRETVPFRIFDNDIVPADSIVNGYNTVIQNLRLVKRPGVNRWEQREKRWSEAALGEDHSGNILLIFSRIPMTMHDFNNLVLSLPIGLQCAQHLEGGPPASLYLHHNGVEIARTGIYGADCSSENSDSLFDPLPNVIGVVKR